MPTYEQNKKSIQRYAATQERLNVWYPKELMLKDKIKNHISVTGESMQRFIIRAIEETLKSDNAQ